MTGKYKICFGNIDKSLWCYYEQNNRKLIKYKHTVDKVLDHMPIDEMTIDIWFISIV